MKENPFVLINSKKPIRCMVVDETVYFSLTDIGAAIGIGNPHEAKRYLDENEIKKGQVKNSGSFISVKNVFRLIFYAKNNVLNNFVSWLINILLPFAYENSLIVVQDDKPKPQGYTINKMTAKETEEDELDDEAYILLNKELKKQIFIFNKESIKVEQIFMEIGEILDGANEVIKDADAHLSVNESK